MATKVNLQKSGMGITEGTVVRWLKTVGSKVAKGEILAEIETAKAIQEVAAPVSGTLAEISVADGQTVEVDTMLAVIEEDKG